MGIIWNTSKDHDFLVWFSLKCVTCLSQSVSEYKHCLPQEGCAFLHQLFPHLYDLIKEKRLVCCQSIFNISLALAKLHFLTKVMRSGLRTCCRQWYLMGIWGFCLFNCICFSDSLWWMTKIQLLLYGGDTICVCVCEIHLFHTKEEREEGRVHGCLAQRRYWRNICWIKK